jgi:hypothetical protein
MSAAFKNKSNTAMFKIYLYRNFYLKLMNADFSNGLPTFYRVLTVEKILMKVGNPATIIMDKKINLCL